MERGRSEGRSSSWAGESSFQSRAVNRITLYLRFFFLLLYEQILAVLGTQKNGQQYEMMDMLICFAMVTILLSICTR